MRNAKTRAATAALALAMLAFGAPASAVPVAWFLNSDVAFDDGAIAISGVDPAFVYDADAGANGTYSQLSFISAFGSVLPILNAYTAEHPVFAASFNSATALVAVDGGALADLTGTSVIQLIFATPLTNAGGTVQLVTDPQAVFRTAEATCADADCLTSGAPLRFAVSGSLTGVPLQTTPMPAPAGLPLLGLGIVVLGLIGRRRRAA